jgi:hypothetical protein
MSVIDWRINQAQNQMIGTISSPFYQQYVDGDSWVWACDVDIGQDEPLQSVPVASSNREIIYAELGKSVLLTRMNDGKWCISGLSKTCMGREHIIYMTFMDDLGSIARESWSGSLTRLLTLGELGDLGPGAFGAIPLGAHGRFAPDGTLIAILES